MEEIIEKLINIIKILIQEQNMTWLNILSSIAPIILTLISISSAWIQHKQNKKLQIEIANRDISNYLRQNLTEIYSSYFEGYSVIRQANGNLAEVFAFKESFEYWIIRLENACDKISLSYNYAKLILNDENSELLNTLKKSFDLFGELYDGVNSYLHNKYLNDVNNAYKIISSKYGIKVNDIRLIQNPLIIQEYIKCFDNVDTLIIKEKIKKYNESIEDKNFDKYFKDYIKISKI